jgi:signal transduction histidine kinase
MRSATRLFVTLFLVVAVPFSAFGVGAAASAHKALEREAMASSLATARLGADAVEAHFEGLIRHIETFVTRRELPRAVAARDEVAVRGMLQELVTTSGALNRAFVTDVAGVELYDWPPDPNVIGRSFAFRDWYQGVTKSAKTYVSEVYRRAALPPQLVVAIATSVPRADGAGTQAYLVAQYGIPTLSARLEGIRPAETGTLTLIDRGGQFVTVGQVSDTEPKAFKHVPIVEEMLASGEVSRFAADPVTGVPSLLSSAHAEAIGWVVLAQVPTATVFAPATAMERSLVLLAVVCLVVLLGLGFVSLNVVRRHHVALLEMQRQKDLLAEMILHDLRNPLAATLGSIDLIRSHSAELAPMLREDVTRAAHSAKRARQLLNALMDIVRMEEGVLVLHRVRVDLSALVRAKVDEYRPLATAAGIELSEANATARVETELDPDVISRVLENLLTNAIKHTPRGGRAVLGAEADLERRRAIVRVSDTGEGIPAESMPLLFHKFTRIEGQEMRRPHDVGLGLLFCRMAVELHGGTIEAESAQGKGSVFRFELPLGST